MERENVEPVVVGTSKPKRIDRRNKCNGGGGREDTRNFANGGGGRLYDDPRNLCNLGEGRGPHPVKLRVMQGGAGRDPDPRHAKNNDPGRSPDE